MAYSEVGMESAIGHILYDNHGLMNSGHPTMQLGDIFVLQLAHGEDFSQAI